MLELKTDIATARDLKGNTINLFDIVHNRKVEEICEKFSAIRPYCASLSKGGSDTMSCTGIST